MDIIEARKIIDSFQKSIKDLRPNSIVQSKNSLPYTVARIKYAHFIYGEDLLLNKNILDGKLNVIIESYGLIKSLFRENDQEVNEQYRNYLHSLKEGRITNFRMPNPFGDPEYNNEFRNFLAEEWFITHRVKLFTDDPVGAFIYEVIEDKARKDGNVKLLLELANSKLTRFVAISN